MSSSLNRAHEVSRLQTAIDALYEEEEKINDDHPEALPRTGAFGPFRFGGFRFIVEPYSTLYIRAAKYEHGSELIFYARTPLEGPIGLQRGVGKVALHFSGAPGHERIQTSANGFDPLTHPPELYLEKLGSWAARTAASSSRREEADPPTIGELSDLNRCLDGYPGYLEHPSFFTLLGDNKIYGSESLELLQERVRAAQAPQNSA